MLPPAYAYTYTYTYTYASLLHAHTQAQNGHSVAYVPCISHPFLVCVVRAGAVARPRTGTARAVEFVQQRVFSNSNHNGNRECVCILVENSERRETLEFPE